MASEAEQLETGWLSATPVEDSILRRFLFSQADVNEAVAKSLGGRVDRTDEVFLADAGIPVAYLNEAVLARPLTGPDDSVLDVVAAFYRGSPNGALLLSIWPTPDLTGRGWSLAGHPAMVLRSPGPVVRRPPADVEVNVASRVEDFVAAERVVVEGYPLDEAKELPAGALLSPALAEAGVVVRLGLLDGEPVGVGNCHVSNGLVNLCLAATLPAARRRGVWEALMWARVEEAPDLPAVAFTSDYSRPGFISRGFLPITRFTLWVIPPT